MQRSTERFSDKADVTALMGAFCFFLSAIEYMLPKPMPFMRLGIANLPILLAVDILPFRWFLALAAVKVIGMSLISGTLFSYVALFSLAGTMAAALVMWGARRAGGRFISQIGVSIAGAMVSNAVQILIARFLVFRETAWLIAPLFLGMGLATGAALGVFAESFARTSLWYARAAGLPDPMAAIGTGASHGESGAEGKRGGFFSWLASAIAAGKARRAARKSARDEKRRPKLEKAAAARTARRARAERLFAPGALALAGMVVTVAFLFQPNVLLKGLMLIAFIIAARAVGKRYSLATTLSVSLGIIIANLIVPSGKVLGTLLGLRITQGALIEGIEKALTFEGLMMLSKASIAPGLKLPGRIGRIVAASFVYYDRIVEYKGRIKAASLSRDADDLMLRVWGFADTASADTASADTAKAEAAGIETAQEAMPEAAAAPEAHAPDTKSRGKGAAILVTAGIAAWALTLLPRLI
jgi:heptaprenyl diphosphate synthase